MAEMTDYLEGALIDHVLRNTSMTSPTTVYVALHTASPTETGAVAELSVANGYAREAVTFGADTDGVATNSGAITFTASGASWGTITHISIWDASSAGNALLWSAMASSKTIADGESLSFATSSITATFA